MKWQPEHIVFKPRYFMIAVPITLTIISLTAILFLNSVFAYAEPGEEWDQQTPPPEVTLNDIVWGNNQFVAIGDLVTILTSADGNSWSVRHYDYLGQSGDLYGIAWGRVQNITDMYVAVGEEGIILTSGDGLVWTDRNSGISSNLYSVVYGGTPPNNRFVAVGHYGVILTSQNGINWVAQNSGVGVNLYGVTWSDSQFVAVGANGIILTSPDGLSWTLQNSGRMDALYDVAWGGNKFVAIGRNSTILTSSDGIIWAFQVAPSNWWGCSPEWGCHRWLKGLTWGGNQFIAVGDKGAILNSVDGINWIVQEASTSIIAMVNCLEGIAWSGSKFVAVGWSGIIIGSPPAEKDTNANLSAISVSSGTLNPGFLADVTGYTLAVPHNTEVIEIDVALSAPDSSLFWWAEGGYLSIDPDGLSGRVDLIAGNTEAVINIMVTAADGETQKTYTINVNRSAAVGDPIWTSGLYDSHDGVFHLHGLAPFRFGPRNSTWLPVAGDWNGNGTENVGLYDSTDGVFHLHGLAPFRFGPRSSSWKPVAGQW